MRNGSAADVGSTSRAGQPSPLARAARELLDVLAMLHADQLSAAERAALRALLEELRHLRRA